MTKYYQGKFSPKNPKKYKGDYNNIQYRSSWELALFVWLDNNSSVTKWSSEEIVIKYFCPTDNKYHRYFIDFYIEFSNGDKYIVEVKPSKQTLIPENKKGKRKSTHLNETLTYIKNQAKWKTAESFAKSKNMKFQVWTEKTLTKLGIRLINSK